MRYVTEDMSTERESTVMRRGYGEALMSAAAIALLLMALVAMDGRVREELSLRFTAGPSINLATAEGHVMDLTHVITKAARDQSVAHAPLVIFSVAALVLVLFMLRT